MMNSGGHRLSGFELALNQIMRMQKQSGDRVSAKLYMRRWRANQAEKKAAMKETP